MTIPTDWTAEQADVAINLLLELSEEIQRVYAEPLRQLWNERNRDRYKPERPWLLRGVDKQEDDIA